MKAVRVGDLKIGAGLVIIAGPCVIEDEKTTLKTLELLKKAAEDIGLPLIFKSSYDKANRTSISSYRGPGLKKGLSILEKAKREFSVPILTDVHCRTEVEAVAEVADVIQIPALLSRQTDLLVSAGRTKRAINIKKGQFMSPRDIRHAIDKVLSTGNRNIILTERGTSFGYNNLIVDFRGIPIMRDMGFPVVFDATHSVQMPSALGKSSGGDRKMAKYLLRAAVAVGVDGVFMEVHQDPERALCDGPNSIALKDFKSAVARLKEMDRAARG
ncbi:MAG: 3-deoxy-8-phosphooctulonate synthase [Deltaproteobacteria bacterium]|nr:3-deoxy-8-phosphooctulonate synthase [Deltaproteobacteria bacterium]